jgi:putative flippase GtrA
MKGMKFMKAMKVLERFGRFNAVGALGIGVQLAVLWVLVELWGVNYAIATAIAVGLAVVHNFLWHQRWTWEDRVTRGSQTVLRFAWFVGTNGTISLLGNLAVMLMLVSGAGWSPLLANSIAIGACGLLNFAVSDLIVF